MHGHLLLVLVVIQLSFVVYLHSMHHVSRVEVLWVKLFKRGLLLSFHFLFVGFVGVNWVGAIEYAGTFWKSPGVVLCDWVIVVVDLVRLVKILFVYVRIWMCHLWFHHNLTYFSLSDLILWVDFWLMSHL